MIIFDNFKQKNPTNINPTNNSELDITCFYGNYKNFYDILFNDYQIGLIKKII